MKSLDNLKALLANAERAYELANYIDNTERMMAEKKLFKARIGELRARIEHREITLKEIL